MARGASGRSSIGRPCFSHIVQAPDYLQCSTTAHGVHACPVPRPPAARALRWRYLEAQRRPDPPQKCLSKSTVYKIRTCTHRNLKRSPRAQSTYLTRVRRMTSSTHIQPTQTHTTLTSLSRIQIARPAIIPKPRRRYSVMYFSLSRWVPHTDNSFFQAMLGAFSCVLSFTPQTSSC